MKTIINLVAIIVLLFCSVQSIAQNSVDLESIYDAVVGSSYQVKSAKNQRDIVQQEYKFFKSQLKPSLSLAGSLPNYSKTSTSVIQPDGSIAFQPISQANSSLMLFASQVIPSTGGSIFAVSDIRRFDDFSTDFNQYNGVPIRIGISQPIFGINPWKYRSQIQESQKEISDRTFQLQVESALGQATDLYFEVLIAKQSLGIAETNEAINEKLLIIAEERLALGKVSRDEKLQLEIELNNAKLAVSQTSSWVEQSIAALYTFLGKDIVPFETGFEVPEILESIELNVEKLIASHKTNRPEFMAYQRDLVETNLNLAEAKAEFGLQAEIRASIGLARAGDQFKDVYVDPFDEQQFNLSFSIPILDWGKKKSAMNRVKIQKEEIEQNYKQQFLELENNIRQRSIRLVRLQQEIKLLEDIMLKAEERFSISNERYVLGDIDITNLTLAQREKDQSMNNYINALKTFWVTYHELRTLTGFDIMKNSEINYN